MERENAENSRKSSLSVADPVAHLRRRRGGIRLLPPPAPRRYSIPVKSNNASGIFLIGLSALLLLSFFLYPDRTASVAMNDIPFFLVLLVHLVWGLLLLSSTGRRLTGREIRRNLYLPEPALSVTILLFAASYLYATNANMDYVQRFIESGGNLRLAPDSRSERLLVFFRFGPFLVTDLVAYGMLARWRNIRWISRTARMIDRWALALVLLGSGIAVLSLPSFLTLDGIAILGWIALVPLFLVFRYTSMFRAVLYGILHGVFFTLLHHYWLGTFSLISLQVTLLVFLGFYALFMIPALFIFKRSVRLSWLVLPLAWAFFDYARSMGFFGFPWGMIGLSQYGFLPLIQIASVTGVWGVNFLVLLANAAVAESLSRQISSLTLRWTPVAATAAVLVLVVATGTISLAASGEQAGETSRIALVQHNADSRKHDYHETFEVLRRLTDRALEQDPDLVVWSETAFVPNISRWSREDPDEFELARLVRDFLAYQATMGTWLLTGNDDYVLTVDADGEEVREDYNAAVLFAPDGTRVATYRKNHLVPFTEYFPFEEQVPWLHELLLDFDVTLWEPGLERTVFEHPDFRFASPICFEDAFPDDVRRFVLGGADVIVNISNDYWSLTEVEAKQHYIASLFRAVENRRPLLRSTASGLTSYVDVQGRLVEHLPYYEAGILVVDLPLRERGFTLYTRWGDWFPWTCFVLLVLLILSQPILPVPIPKERPRTSRSAAPVRRRELSGNRGE